MEMQTKLVPNYRDDAHREAYRLLFRAKGKAILVAGIFTLTEARKIAKKEPRVSIWSERGLMLMLDPSCGF
jgi:hypothetical protein